tara:strand:+ start:7890 stop:8060 length:171 start_codon:yes stop_codon:yes gene_type:complete
MASGGGHGKSVGMVEMSSFSLGREEGDSFGWLCSPADFFESESSAGDTIAGDFTDP